MKAWEKYISILQHKTKIKVFGKNAVIEDQKEESIVRQQAVKISH